MKTETLRIEGMSCNHCVMSVRRQLAQIEALDVEDVQVGVAVVRYEEGAVSREQLERAVATAGFQVIGHE